MNSKILIGTGLGLEPSWKIAKIGFKSSKSLNELHIHIAFKKGTKFKDESGKLCSVNGKRKPNNTEFISMSVKISVTFGLVMNMRQGCYQFSKTSTKQFKKLLH